MLGSSKKANFVMNAATELTSYLFGAQSITPVASSSPSWENVTKAPYELSRP